MIDKYSSTYTWFMGRLNAKLNEASAELVKPLDEKQTHEYRVRAWAAQELIDEALAAIKQRQESKHD